MARDDSRPKRSASVARGKQGLVVRRTHPKMWKFSKLIIILKKRLAHPTPKTNTPKGNNISLLGKRYVACCSRHALRGYTGLSSPWAMWLPRSPGGSLSHRQPGGAGASALRSRVWKLGVPEDTWLLSALAQHAAPTREPQTRHSLVQTTWMTT